MLFADVAVGYLHLDCEHYHVRGCRTSRFQLQTLKIVCWVVMVNCRSQMQGMLCMPGRQLRKCNFKKKLLRILLFFYIQPSSWNSDLKIVAFYCRTCTGSRKVATHQDVHSWLFFLLSFTASETSLGPIEPPIQWVHTVLSLGIKWLGYEADQSYPTKFDIHDRIYTSCPTVFM